MSSSHEWDGKEKWFEELQFGREAGSSAHNTTDLYQIPSHCQPLTFRIEWASHKEKYFCISLIWEAGKQRQRQGKYTVVGFDVKPGEATHVTPGTDAFTTLLLLGTELALNPLHRFHRNMHSTEINTMVQFPTADLLEMETKCQFSTDKHVLFFQGKLWWHDKDQKKKSTVAVSCVSNLFTHPTIKSQNSN